MSVLDQSSSSSDDDDMLEALKEATDSQFLKESLFCNKDETGNKVNEEKIAPPKSLRRNIEFVDESNEFGVTQDFKNFVAKQLAKSLDKCVREIDSKNTCSELRDKKKRVNNSEGIKLMSNSKVNLTDLETNEEESIEHNKRGRKKLRGEDNSAETISKCKEVAVQPDWVLSKASTAVWTERPKGAVFKYKKSGDGGLVEIN